MSACSLSPNTYSTSLDATVRHLVTDDKGISLLAAAIVAIDLRFSSQEIERQFVGLGLLSTAASFKEQPAQIVFDLIARLELTHLQRCEVTRRVTNAADQNRRIRKIIVLDQQSEQRAQILLHHPRHGVHRPGHVKQHSNGVAGRMRVAVA